MLRTLQGHLTGSRHGLWSTHAPTSPTKPWLRGRVETISPVAEVRQGDATYTLIIELEHTDPKLRPGMTARAEILSA